MPNLYAPTYPPTWTVPDPVLQRMTPAPTTIRAVTYSFNPIFRDFQVDGTGDVPLTDAGAAAVQWAAKAVSTQRGAHLIYGRTFGADIRTCLLAGSHQATENALTVEMRRAVKRDNRISDLTDFQFAWQQTMLEVAYRVVLTDGRSKQTQLDIPLQ